MLRAKWKHGQRSKGNQGNSIWKKTENIKETEIILRNHTVSLELRKLLDSGKGSFVREEWDLAGASEDADVHVALYSLWGQRTKCAERWPCAQGCRSPRLSPIQAARRWCRWRNSGSERWCHLPGVTQLTTGRVGAWTRIGLTPKPLLLTITQLVLFTS